MAPTVQLRSLAFGPQVCGSLPDGTTREWLVPDGRGGYAMGTVSGLRTRRYHGLLVVSGDTPARRMMGLASLDPVLTVPGGARIPLATHEWASGAIEPSGYQLLESFTLSDGLPTWQWRVGEVVLERTLAMRSGHPSVAVVHTLLAGGPVELSLEALCTWRDAHGERHAGDGLRVAPTADGVVVEEAYRVAGPGFVKGGDWYVGTHHREEAERGLAADEDLMMVGAFTATLHPGESLEVSAWAGDLGTPPPPPREVIAAARTRNHDLPGGRLAVAADAFIVRTGTGVDVVAGYPWFGAWSRDTMTAYEGLFLATGRVEEGRRLLLGYAATLSEGMLANTADTGQTEYNTADATLWFLHAVDRHLAATGDTDLAAELHDPLTDVVWRHVEGCRYGIRVDPDGLLTQGADGHALTWMDAVVGGVPVTPRRGKAVELNALWVNGLAALSGLRDRLGRDHHDLDALHTRAVRSFAERFPSPRGWLCDVVDGPDGDDPALRPNQLLAFGLPYAPLRSTEDSTAVRACARHLLTPLGPRSLSPEDHGYVGRHRGDGPARDRAYHQGTVWPWLIGPFADAAAAVGVPTPRLLDGLWAHVDEWGLGSVSETADGDPPHRATGCPFQAWSVAELLRLSTKDPSPPRS
jgi:predicted glycogen debranching enzyme